MNELDKLIELLTEAVKQITDLKARVKRLKAQKPRWQRPDYRIDGTKKYYSQAVSEDDR